MEDDAVRRSRDDRIERQSDLQRRFRFERLAATVEIARKPTQRGHDETRRELNLGNNNIIVLTHLLADPNRRGPFFGIDVGLVIDCKTGSASNGDVTERSVGVNLHKRNLEALKQGPAKIGGHKPNEQAVRIIF